MHAPNFAVFSIFFLPLSIFFFLFFVLSFSISFLLLFSYYFWGTSKSWFVKSEEKKQSIDACPQFCCVFYLLFYYYFCRGSLFSQFSLPSSLRSFLYPLQVPPFSSMSTASLYNGLIPWDFCLLPLRLHQLLLVGCGHPLRTAHQPIGCSTTITTG